jgi:hypothetical protein
MLPAMTLVLSLVTRWRAFHVSDRLLTQKAGDLANPDYKEFDAFSNKTVILRTPDALTVCGYSGRAYIDNMPTDSWIAQSFMGTSLGGGEFVWHLSGGPPPVSLSKSIWRLKTDCDAALARLPESERRQSPLRINIAGWRNDRHRPRMRPVSLELVQTIVPPDIDRMIFHFEHPKRWAWDRTFRIRATPDNVPVEEARWILDKLQSEGSASPDACEDVLVQGIQRIAQRNPTVGRNVLAVRLEPTEKPNILIQYHPDPATRTSEQTSAYSPWILVPPSAWGPSLTTSGVDASSVQWVMRGLPTTAPSAFLQTQRRPRYPQS